MFDSTGYSLKNLKNAQDVLQQAHDYIEANGFDINTYEPTSSYSKRNPSCCYIGSVRHVAKVTASPGLDENRTDYAADWVKGKPKKKLTIALSMLDQVALRDEHFTPEVVARINKNYPRSAAGRFIEALGLGTLELSDDESSYGLLEVLDWEEHEQEQALKFMREALSELHYLIESREKAEAELKAEEEAALT